MPAQRGASWLKGRCQWHRGNRHPAADRGNPRGGSSPVRLTGVNGFKRKALCAFNQGGTADHSVPSLSKGRFFIAPSRRRQCVIGAEVDDGPLGGQLGIVSAIIMHHCEERSDVAICILK